MSAPVPDPQSPRSGHAETGLDTVVVGGGIAGLCAAYDLARGGRRVLVLEGADRVGGKLRSAEVGGVSVDVGAESMLNRRPEGVALVREVGLEVVHPASTASRVWVQGRLRPMPRSMLGVPLDADDLAASGVLSADGLARARAGLAAPPLVLADDADVAIGDLVATRFGDEVCDRLAEPLLGGVYAGHARELSARATAPAALALLTHTAPAPLPSDPARPPTPVFAGVPGGLGRLPSAVVAAGGFEVRTSSPVREIAATATGWRLTVGSARDPEVVDAPEVVLATPATPTARLLTGLAPVAAAELAAIESASVAVVTLAVEAAQAAALLESGASGFLVPPAQRAGIKAATFSANKWAWVREAGRGAPDGDLMLLRTSLGRHREEAALQHPDDALVARSLDDLAAMTGVALHPVDTHVQRWGGALPQYAVGHLDRTARVRAAVADLDRTSPGSIAVCGSAYDGVGVPACLASARRAVDVIAGGE